MKRLATQCMLVQYADDSQFIFTGTIKEVEKLIRDAESTLKEVKLYFDINGLKINPQKTQIIFIGSRQNLSRIPPNLSINFDGNLIVPCKFVKKFGTFLDNYLVFDKHVDEIYRKTMGTLIYINRIKDKVDKDTRVLIVQSLALSVINYCSKIWGSANKSQLQRIQKIQNFAAKVATGNARKYDHATPYIQQLKWLKIEKKYCFDVCVLMYKVVNNLIQTDLFPLVTVREIHQVPTRQSSDLYVQRARTDVGKREMSIRGPEHWSQLPLNIKESNNS